jgi:DNA-binding response OmpR family regulator
LIFIVDDDPGVRGSLARRFEAEGLALACWADAKGAWAAMRATTPIAVVLDYRLRAMNGLRFLELLRTDTMLSRVPVVFYSGTDDKAVRAEAHRLGAAGWFLKISEHDEMVATVLRIARATAA